MPERVAGIGIILLGAHLDTATSGITRSGAPVSDPAIMRRYRGRAGPEVGAPVAVTRCALLSGKRPNGLACSDPIEQYERDDPFLERMGIE